MSGLKRNPMSAYPNLARTLESGKVAVLNTYHGENYWFISPSGYKEIIGPVRNKEYAEKRIRELML